MYDILVETVKLINQTKTPDIALDIKFLKHPIIKQFPNQFLPLSTHSLTSSVQHESYTEIVARHQLSLQSCSKESRAMRKKKMIR